MQHFLHTDAPSSGSGVVSVDRGDSYAEFLHQSSFDGAIWFSSYIAKIEDTVFAAMTCWDQQFDPVFQQLTDPQHGSILADEFRKIWPTFFGMLDNAVDERFGDGALAEFVDPDDLNRKWFVAVLVSGNVPDAVLDERLYAAADKAVEISLAMAVEFQKELSWRQKAKIAARGGAAGYRQGKQFVKPWEDRLGWLQTMLGS